MLDFIYSFLLVLPIVFVISFFWVQAIDKMKNNHPDYDGDDIFGL